MRRNFLLFLAVLICSTSSWAKTIVPVTSTEGNEVWYMIKCNPRNPDNLNATWITASSDSKIIYDEYTGADEQYWKVVQNSTGVAIVNKKTGAYIDADNRKVGGVTQRILMVPNMPVTALQLVPSTNYPNHKWPGWDGTVPGIFILDLTNGTTVVNENKAITVGDANNAFALTIYAPASGDLFVANQPGWVANLNQVVLFRTQAEVLDEIKLGLFNMITEAKKAYDNSSDGINPGQFNAGEREGLLGVIEIAQEIYDNPAATAEEYISATKELSIIYTMFKTFVITPQVSTVSNSVWYFIQGTRPANTYLTAPAAGSGTPVKGLTVIPDDTQLWKLVPNGDGFSLQNKATLEYIQTDFPTGAMLSTQPDMPVKPLRVITSSEIFNKSFRFWIEHSTSSTEALRFHAGNSGLMNWTGDRNDNSSWLFMSYLDALRTTFLTALNDAKALLNSAVVGTKIGQYSEQAYNEFKAQIDTAEALDDEFMNEQEFLDEAAKLKTAANGFLCNSDITTLQSPTPATTDYWYRMVNAATVTYAKNKAMSSNGRGVDQKFTYENINAESDAQLFRFELNETGTAIKAIVNKVGDTYVGPSGMILNEPVQGIEFAVEPLDGFSFRIVPTGFAPLHAAAANVEILNWNAGAGSASAWRLVFVKELSNIEHLAAARTITVSSSDPSKGNAVITGTSDVTITTDIKKISVTATANKGIFFTGWTNAAGDTLSKSSTYIYTGENSIELKANFINGYYKPMTRFYVAASPAIQQAERYLHAAYAIVGEKTQTIFENITVNPNPIDETVTPGQEIGNALLNYTSTRIDIPSGTSAFNFKAVGRQSELTVENLQWTQQITFIDWNQDFDFVDEGEISEKNNAAAYDTLLIDPAGFTRTIQIPAGLHDGYYRMRVVYNEPTSGSDNWGLSIWSNRKIRNGVAYDFEIKYGAPTNVENTYQTQLSVRVVNSRIFVDGVDKFELYNIAGQKLRSDLPVNTGVYLVKSGGKAQKVFVR